MVGDNANLMPATAKLLKLEYFSCFAHVFNLVVNRALEKLKYNEEIENLMTMMIILLWKIA